jgi:hypothetical protein
MGERSRVSASQEGGTSPQLGDVLQTRGPPIAVKYTTSKCKHMEATTIQAHIAGYAAERGEGHWAWRPCPALVTAQGLNLKP